MTTTSEKIYPFCYLHYTDAIKLPKLIYMIETFCPEFAKTWDDIKHQQQYSNLVIPELYK